MTSYDGCGGRLGGQVTVWTTGQEAPVGLTVSSIMVANGTPGYVLGLVDPDSDLAEQVVRTGSAAVSLLRWRHRDLAEVFAGQAPSPGGPFRTGDWRETACGARCSPTRRAGPGGRLRGEPQDCGWSVLLRLEVEHVELDEDDEPLVHRRGGYLRPPPDR